MAGCVCSCFISCGEGWTTVVHAVFLSYPRCRRVISPCRKMASMISLLCLKNPLILSMGPICEPFRNVAMAEFSIPSVYREGYEKARAANPELTEKYIEYTTVDDPLADAVIDALAAYDPGDANRIIKAAMQQDEKGLEDAPEELRFFFDESGKKPEWFDPKALYPGYRAFHAHSDLFIPAFFLVTVRNAATLIAKSFYASGRVMSGFGMRRIRQNTRHFIEIMMPGALERYGDGWKLSVRIRLVHARLRRLIREESNWDESVFGAPLSSAHIALASANFSATMLSHAEILGAKLDDETRNGFMQAWRYASWLIGAPEHLLFEGDYEKTLEFARLATLCEPSPNEESAAIANALLEALPLIAGKTDFAEHDAMVKHVSRVSRAVLGDELADQLQIPKLQTKGLLQWMKWSRSARGVAHRIAPKIGKKWQGNNFAFLLEASKLEDLRYQLPDHLDTEVAIPW